MSSALKGKLLAGFVLVFAAGFAAGTFFGAFQSQHHHYDFLHRHSLAQRVRGRLQKRLQLTPEQIKKTAPIVDQTVRQLEAIRAETGQRVHDTFLAADRAIAPQLSAEQQTRLKAIEAHHEENRQGHP
jgi:hypothetical protein